MRVASISRLGATALAVAIFCIHQPLRADQIRAPASVSADECSFSIDHSSVRIGPGGGTQRAFVSAAFVECTWTAESHASWLTVDPPSGGGGIAPVYFTAAPNPFSVERAGTVTVAGLTVTVTQVAHRRASHVDFSGEGASQHLLYNRTTGQYEFTPGAVNVWRGAWAGGWTILPASFNGDAKTDLFFIRDSGLGHAEVIKAVVNIDRSFTFFSMNWELGWDVHAVDFNGDGLTDIFAYNSATGRWMRALTTTPGGFDYSYGTWAAGFSIFPADFNDDGRTDLFLYNKIAGHVYAGLWLRVMSSVSGLAFEYETGAARWSPDWDVYPVDFDGDSRSDLFLYQPTTGYWVRVFFNSGAPAYEYGRWAPNFTIVPGHFTPDARMDLYLYNRLDGMHFVVLTESSGAFSYVGPDFWAPHFEVQTFDRNLDGIFDLLLYNPANGNLFKMQTVTPGVYDWEYTSSSPGFTAIVRPTH